jgi:hypothetical protein
MPAKRQAFKNDFNATIGLEVKLYLARKMRTLLD